MTFDDFMVRGGHRFFAACFLISDWLWYAWFLIGLASRPEQ
jgi:hypothetical protein